tara:strand:- start:66 stop:374 length:309 start_codon:yes stop_codon:yes gene_type:complete
LNARRNAFLLPTMTEREMARRATQRARVRSLHADSALASRMFFSRDTMSCIANRARRPVRALCLHFANDDEVHREKNVLRAILTILIRCNLDASRVFRTFAP